MYDPMTGSWLSPDPLAHKYTSWSPYAYCAGNPIYYFDPNGASTYVTMNKNGTYSIQGGNLHDNDLNIYIVRYDENNNIIHTGISIGKTTSITSFYNSDENSDGNIIGWTKGSIIDPNDESGIKFIANLIMTDPSLLEYGLGARVHGRYDFKSTNGTNQNISGIDIYRGMPLTKDSSGSIIYSSARDIGNIMAGYIAGKKGLSWNMSRIGFDGYQIWSNIKHLHWPKLEGISTQNAQYWGWEKGHKFR